MSNRVLDVVDNILSSPRQWTKHAAAKDYRGVSVPWQSDNAVCFCLSGALDRAGYITNATPEEYHDALETLAKATNKLGGPGGIIKYNDRNSTTFADVKAVIAYARAM